MTPAVLKDTRRDAGNRRSEPLLTIVTTTRNCVGIIDDYVRSFNCLDRTRFNWVVVDAASTDGTREYLQNQVDRFSCLLSEPDSGIYFGLNKAVALVQTRYYLVFGADDRPSPTLLDDILPLLTENPALLLGSTRLMPSGRIKRPGRRWQHILTWGRVISHHSVGTVIRTDLHDRFGRYNTYYRIVADGAFLTAVLRSIEVVTFTDSVFGDYNEEGLSGRSELLSVSETFLAQSDAGSNTVLQSVLLILRLAKLRKSLRLQRASEAARQMQIRA